MRKLLTVLAVFICVFINAQEYIEKELFNMSGVTGDTITSFSYKVGRGQQGALIEIVFTGVNCDSLGLDIGYGTNNLDPVFLDTIPGVHLPITLDKTVYTVTYKGVESNVVSVDISWYDANYIWIRITDKVTCTRGIIKARFKRK